MGCDKAWLEIDGSPLIKRQLELVRNLGGTEVFISGRPGADYSSLGCRVLEDTFPDAGPLAGIERGLAVTNSLLLLVLAVDLPRMEVRFLRELGAACGEGQGAVPDVCGHLEPLAACYPKTAHPLAMRQLQGGRNAVHEFATACETAGLLKRYPVAPADFRLFLNWNTPGDFVAGG
jgi:molybdenum cofactor guanylyltransferase